MPTHRRETARERPSSGRRWRARIQSRPAPRRARCPCGGCASPATRPAATPSRGVLRPPAGELLFVQLGAPRPVARFVGVRVGRRGHGARRPGCRIARRRGGDAVAAEVADRPRQQPRQAPAVAVGRVVDVRLADELVRARPVVVLADEHAEPLGTEVGELCGQPFEHVARVLAGLAAVDDADADEASRMQFPVELGRIRAGERIGAAHALGPRVADAEHDVAGGCGHGATLAAPKHE